MSQPSNESAMDKLRKESKSKAGKGVLISLLVLLLVANAGLLLPGKLQKYVPSGKGHAVVDVVLVLLVALVLYLSGSFDEL